MSLHVQTREEALLQHHRRVAAYATEIGRSLGLGDADLDLLKRAAEWHDFPIQLLAPEVQSRLLADVLGGEWPAAESGCLTEGIRAVVGGLQGSRPAPEYIPPTEILYIADALDEHLEAEPYFPAEHGALPEERDFSIQSVAMGFLRKASLEDLRGIIPQLPVFPAAAVQAITDLLRPDVENRDLERIARKDPVLAGQLLRVANSARFGTVSEIRNLQQGISYIGPNLTKNVLLAAALRPVFTRPELRPLWRHSVECAEISGTLAERTKAAPPSEAVLAGLVHDIGVLAFSMLNLEARLTCGRLIEHGCRRSAAETVVYGFDHGEAGAQVLQAWKFPPDLIEAVRHHHAPERTTSPLASILYLSEFCSGSDEDLPSAVRLRIASSRVRLSMDAVTQLETPGDLTAALTGKR